MEYTNTAGNMENSLITDNEGFEDFYEFDDFGHEIGAIMLTVKELSGKSASEKKKYIQELKRQNTDISYAVIGFLYLAGAEIEANLNKAAFYFRKGEKIGNVFCTYCLAKMYLEGIGLTKNPKKAFKRYEIAAATKRSVAMCKMADLCLCDRNFDFKLFEGYFWAKEGLESGYDKCSYFFDLICRGGGKEQDLKKRFKAYEDLARKNIPVVICGLASLYADGRGCERNIEKAVGLYEKAGRKGLAYAYNELGLIYTGGKGLEVDNKKAMEYFVKAESLGYVPAIVNQGHMYHEGLGVWFDDKKALECYEKGAGKNYAPGLFFAARMYRNGEAVPVDLKKARKYFEKAADLGFTEAMIDIAEMYMDEKDFQNAVKWYKKGADLGNPVALNSLGARYYSGEGVHQDYKKAFELFSKASEQDYPPAFYSLAVMYCDGIYVKKDIAKSIELLRKAADFGDREAKDFLQELLEDEKEGINKNHGNQ